MNLELQITTDLKSLPAAIEFNYPELKASLENCLEKFKGLLVAEDGIKRAKEDRAEINKIAQTIASARIETKKRLLAPFEGFEAKAKELESIAKNAAEGIDAQLREFEAKRTREKANALAAAFATMLKENFGEDMLAPERKTQHWREYFKKATDSRTSGNWLNKSVSEASAARQMNAEIQRCKEALKQLGEIYAGEDVEVQTAAKFALCRHFDLAEAALAVNSFKEQKAAAERAKAESEERVRQDEERRAREAKAKAEAMERAKAELAARRQGEAGAREAAQGEKPESPQEEAGGVPASKPDADPSPATTPVPSGERRYAFTIRVSGLASDLARVREAIAANNCTYERIEWKEI